MPFLNCIKMIVGYGTFACTSKMLLFLQTFKRSLVTEAQKGISVEERVDYII